MAGDWLPTTIGELARPRVEKVLPRHVDVVPYVALEHISSATGRLHGVARSDKATSHKTAFRAGDTLFGKLRPNLRKVARPHFDGVCSTDIIAVAPREGTHSGYLYHLLASGIVYRHVMGDLTGTKMPRTSWERLASFSFRCPPTEEQRCIATILDSIDEAIERTEAVSEATETLRRAVLHEMLTSGVRGWHDKWRHISDLGRIPACWEVLDLGSLLASLTYGTSVPLTDVDSGTPVVRMGDLTDGNVQLTRLRSALSPIPASLHLRDGDLLFNRTNSLDLVGKVAYVIGLRRPTSFASYLLRLRVNPRLADSRWLFELLHSSRTQERLRRMATPGASQANINPMALRSLVVAVPPVDEQRKIAQLMTAIRQTSVTDALSLESLRTVKKAATVALLSGHVRVRAAATISVIAR